MNDNRGSTFKDDLDMLFDDQWKDPEFRQAYREERIAWEMQARAVCRYLRGEVERLEGERDKFKVEGIKYYRWWQVERDRNQTGTGTGTRP